MKINVKSRMRVLKSTLVLSIVEWTANQIQKPTTPFAASTLWALPPKPANYEIILVEKIIGLSSLLSIHKLKHVPFTSLQYRRSYGLTCLYLKQHSPGMG